MLPSSCASRDTVLVRAPTPDHPWPESTHTRLQECADEFAGDLNDGEYTAGFRMKVNTAGHMLDVSAGAPRVEARDLETCMRLALEDMVVPSFVLERATAKLAQQQSSRELMGDMTMTAGATAEEVMAVLEPVIVRAGPVGVGIIVTIVIVAAVAKLGKEMTEECKKEWAGAYDECDKMLSSPNPPPNVTGRYINRDDCARGLVSEHCRGNPVDWNKRGRGASGRRY